MAELFTEEDVRRYAEIIHAIDCNCGSSEGVDRDEVRAILSALAEDGRLRRSGPPDTAISRLGLNRPMVQRLRDCAADYSSDWAGRITIYPGEARQLIELIDSPAESGGALPSDTPALAGRPTMPDES